MPKIIQDYEASPENPATFLKNCGSDYTLNEILELKKWIVSFNGARFTPLALVQVNEYLDTQKERFIELWVEE